MSRGRGGPRLNEQPKGKKEIRMLKAQFIVPIPKKKTRQHVAKLVALVNKGFDFKHSITLIVVPAQVVGDPKNGEPCGFGAFDYRDEKDLKIWLAGHQLPDLEYDEWLEALTSNLAHELAHYEQYRDGKTIQERGVEVRAKRLVERLGLMGIE